MDGKCHHLRDGGEAGDGAVVRRVLPVSALEDQDGASFEEPVVLLVPRISFIPFDDIPDKVKDCLPYGRTRFDGG